ncbi:complement receptor type 2-like isoform X1 [Gopherus evgoodei]|uniref:complement receptor type 2-like isoform X1 n=1 Tax=Gopherus evgoodei TaxID=1825980 RepID=UPI0011CF38F6|nr:complement receptor type 2-like isoform X1 [Gopherus evgoodei]XP_030417502.1 complement receptor type 2-like isoform X1 [Gopherus evgoodei]
MVSLTPGKQRSYIATIPLLLAAAFIVAVHSDCDEPPRFHFAELKEEYRNRSKFAVNSKVEYSCRSGYSKVQKSILRCMSYSQWSDATEFCRAKSCRHPGEPENGRLVILSDLTFGATVNFICEEGYRRIGHAEIKCVLEGSQVTWDRDIPYCQVIPCLPPPKIEHGTHTGTTMEEFNYGSSVTYQCDTVERGQVPFSLIGESSIHCTSTDNVNGDWSGPAPECKVVLCNQPKVAYGKQMTGYSPVYTYRASVLFECEHRYTLKGSNILHCNENGEWDPQSPVCELSSCDDPPYISNTFRDHSNSNLFPAGTVVKYNCMGGYELIPGISSASVTCQKDFTWSEQQEFCRRIRCPSPDIRNGTARPRKELYVYEDKIRIECDRGYALKDNYGLMKCERNGAWHPPLPVCEPACEPPAHIANGQDNRGWKNVFLVGSSVSYSCNRGWLLVGESSIRCTAGDGGTPRWDAPVPECKACEPPAHIANGQDNRGWKNVFLIGSSVSYSCNRGWLLVGVSSIRCTAGDGGTPRWDAPVPECKEIPRCPNPVIENGKQISIRETEYTVGNRVEFQCESGYILEGSKSIKCQTNGKWDPPVPSCIKVGCPKPDVQNGGMVIALDEKEWYDMNENVTFKCFPGYQFSDLWYQSTTDSLAITCSTDGTWTMLPKCEKQINSPLCNMVRESVKFLHCGLSLAELRTHLETQKLYLEIQKFKRGLQKYKE